MSDSPYSDYIKAIKVKIEQSAFITNSENILIGESFDLLGKPDSEFPRAEYQVRNMLGQGYYAQRLQDENVTVSIQGFMRRAQDDLLEQDMVDIINFGQEIRSLIYSFNNDKVSGNTVPKGFVQMDGYPEMWAEFEIMPKTSTFILNITAKFGRHDVNP